MALPDIFRKLGFLALSISLFAGCGGDSDQGDQADQDTSATDTGMHSTKVQKLFYTIPSPIEMSMLIKRAGTSYNGKLLNPVENAGKYTSTSGMALNLGVYGADVSYTSIFDQTQETMFYLSCAKKLADGLGITKAFDKQVLDRIEANLDNKDSLLTLISDSYWESDAYLKENERANVSAFIIVGGWIEGLYLATKINADKPGNNDIKTRIAEQKYSLGNLFGLLKTYKSDENIQALMDDLSPLQKIYDEIEVSAVQPTVTTDEKTQVTTIGGGSESLTVSDEKIKQISDEIGRIRTKIISGN